MDVERPAVAVTDLSAADLLIDAFCDGGTSGTVADDPQARLLSLGHPTPTRQRL